MRCRLILFVGGMVCDSGNPYPAFFPFVSCLGKAKKISTTLVFFLRFPTKMTIFILHFLQRYDKTPIFLFPPRDTHFSHARYISQSK